jgi:hypothetical protein
MGALTHDTGTKARSMPLRESSRDANGAQGPDAVELLREVTMLLPVAVRPGYRPALRRRVPARRGRRARVFVRRLWGVL